MPAITCLRLISTDLEAKAYVIALSEECDSREQEWEEGVKQGGGITDTKMIYWVDGWEIFKKLHEMYVRTIYLGGEKGSEKGRSIYPSVLPLTGQRFASWDTDSPAHLVCTCISPCACSCGVLRCGPSQKPWVGARDRSTRPSIKPTQAYTESPGIRHRWGQENLKLKVSDTLTTCHIKTYWLKSVLPFNNNEFCQ